jgi:hypothetical protein
VLGDKYVEKENDKFNAKAKNAYYPNPENVRSTPKYLNIELAKRLRTNYYYGK